MSTNTKEKISSRTENPTIAHLVAYEGKEYRDEAVRIRKVQKAAKGIRHILKQKPLRDETESKATLYDAMAKEREDIFEARLNHTNSSERAKLLSTDFGNSITRFREDDNAEWLQAGFRVDLSWKTDPDTKERTVSVRRIQDISKEQRLVHETSWTGDSGPTETIVVSEHLENGEYVASESRHLYNELEIRTELAKVQYDFDTSRVPLGF